MTLVKCPNGHFYDPARFGNKCPHCGMAGQQSTGDQTTVSMDVDDQIDFTSKVSGEAANFQKVQMDQSGIKTEPLTSVINEQDKTIAVPEDVLKGVSSNVEPVVGWLVCVEGANKGRDYRLHKGRNFIGRSEKMDVYIENDNTVSRSSHAIVVYDPRSNVYLAQPGDSKELFYLNDKLILSVTELKALDRLSVGSTKLMFVPLCSEKFQW